MQQSFLARIELIFWNFAIRALSQSRLARTFLQRAYAMASDSETALLSIMIAASAIIGLVSGYAFYYLTLNMR